jgi:hypothetical protein
VVPLARRVSRAQCPELEAPLAAFKAAVAALPTREDALVDRLFALECLAKAGRDARQERDRLLPARRATEDYLDESWEPDVPHANVLAQALSTITALDDDPPPSWVSMLDETLGALAKRQARHGVTTTPLVLASVIRGLTASGLGVPSWLLDAVHAYFEAGPTAAATAELAEALSRHRSGVTLAQQATEIVFSDRHASDPGAAVARWWLADRLKGTIEQTAGQEKIATARAQAIVSPPPSDPRLAAMLAEVAGRATESLILLPESELELLRARSKGGALIENYTWRTIFACAPIVLALVYLKPVLGWLGNSHPSAKTLTGLATLLTLALSCIVVTAIWTTLKRLDRDPGLFGVLASIVFAIVPTLAVYFLYPS